MTCAFTVALTDQQVATIRNNAWNGTTTTVVANTQPTAETKPAETKAAEAKPETLESKITAVSDVSAETTVGEMPRLPYTVAATYRDGIHGPDVRVIWPSPTNNAEVLKAGTFTVMGKVPGTDLKAKATVTVKPAAAVEAAPRL